MRNATDLRVAISSAVAEHYERHLGLRDVLVVPNGFPVPFLGDYTNTDRVRDLYGVKPDEFLVVCPARFVIEKGHQYLVEAISLVQRNGISIRCILMGSGPLEGSVRAEIERRALSSVVQICPPVEQHQLFSLMRTADTIVLPTPKGEGFGRVLAEAMALERPIVAAAVGGALDFVENEHTGLLVEPANAEAIASALIRLHRQPVLAAAIGKAARNAIMERFDIEKVAAHWEKVYAKVLAEPGVR
jgi:glycosyltransferase involved in cell wall biosynthesis